MKWITFETEGGGLLKVQPQHLVSIYDELGAVKVSTTSGGVHVLAKGMRVQEAARIASDAGED